MRNLGTACILATVLLSGCANLNTISRVTDLPATPSEGSGGGGQTGAGGKAIHLDAFQRLVIANGDGSTCAEPSPDGMAAYAAALGLSGSVPGSGAGSLSASAQQTAAMIGLRTQSITLMRDALFRLCEARAQRKGQSDVSETMLLQRSQDLTAVVVAVEQLTGAVMASQVLLGGSAGAESQAQLVANQQILESVRKTETDRQQEVAAALTALNDLKTKRDAALTTAQASDGAYKEAAGQTPAPANLPTLERKMKDDATALAAAVEAVGKAEKQHELATQLLADARKVREAVERNQDGALTQAVTHVTGNGQFTPNASRGGLSAETVGAVSQAVQGMVEAVLRKDYLLQACTVFLTSANAPNPQFAATTTLCNSVVDVKVKAEVVEQNLQEQQLRALGRLSTFGAVDDTDSKNVERIKAALAVEGGRARVQAWMKRVLPNYTITQLIYDVSLARYRKQIIDEKIVQ